MQALDYKLHVVCWQVLQPFCEDSFIIFSFLDVLQSPHRHELIIFDSEQFVPKDDNEEVENLFAGLEVGFECCLACQFVKRIVLDGVEST